DLICFLGLLGLLPTSGENVMSIAPLEIFLLRKMVTCSILILPAIYIYTHTQTHSLTLTHTYTHSQTHTHTLSHTHIHTFTHTHTVDLCFDGSASWQRERECDMVIVCLYQQGN